jgi:hypothetical protein
MLRKNDTKKTTNSEISKFDLATFFFFRSQIYTAGKLSVNPLRNGYKNQQLALSSELLNVITCGTPGTRRSAVGTPLLPSPEKAFSTAKRFSELKGRVYRWIV